MVNRAGMLRTANAVGLLVQGALISRAHEMMLVVADGQPEDLLALAEMSPQSLIRTRR